jgi:hypothetical protein
VLAAGVAAAAPSLTWDRGRLARYRGAAAGAASPVVGTAAGETPAVPGQGRGRRVPPQRPISRMSASQAVAGSTRGQSAS